MSFGDYLAAIVGSISWGGVLYVASIVLAAVAVVGGIAVTVALGFKVAERWHWAWNLLVVPAVLGMALFMLLFASWLGIEVA